MCQNMFKRNINCKQIKNIFRSVSYRRDYCLFYFKGSKLLLKFLTAKLFSPEKSLFIRSVEYSNF